MSVGRFAAFGESMMRFMPKGEDNLHFSSMGGDELNVCVALARLGVDSTWVSAVGDRVHSDVCIKEGTTAGVTMDVKRIAGERLGTFFVLPEKKTVVYNRKHSAFALHDPNIFDWNALLKGVTFMHMTGITPLCGNNAYTSWQRALDTALSLGVRVVFDLNHRQQLGTLAELWNKVRPYSSRLEALILSRGQILGLCELEGVSGTRPSESNVESPLWVPLMQGLRTKLNVGCLTCCFKKRDSKGVQTRWSVSVNSEGVTSTEATPVLQRVMEELGGGSAWAAGYIHAKMHGVESQIECLRRADLLAALCQRTQGDFSQVKWEELSEFETRYKGSLVPLATIQDQGATGGNSSMAAVVRALQSECGIIAIIRAKNPDAAIERGIELVGLGAKALEVTMDTPEVGRVLKSLVDAVGDKCHIGVGTVMQTSQVAEIARLGATFALSPINPKGFIKECLRLNVVPISAAFSPNEIFNQHLEGAPIIKLFPAQIWSPKVVKALKTIGDFGHISIAPSGGVSPDNWKTWLESGACSVGMGTKLSGADIKHPTGSEAFKKAREDWNQTGRARAKAMFEEVARFLGPKSNL